LPVKLFNKLNKNLEKSTVIIKAFVGYQIKSLGKVKVTVKNTNNLIETYFEVVDYEELPILGLNDCIKLKYTMNEVNEINK